MADLTTIARVKREINQASFTADEDSTIGDLIDFVSESIRRYCQRNIDVVSYDEVYRGSGEYWLILSDYPVTQIDRVSTSRVPALSIQNTDTSTNQRATVRLTDTGIVLTRVHSGTTTNHTELTFATNATVSAMKTAIIAEGSGWTAQIEDTDFTLWPSSELAGLQGDLNPLSTLRPHGALGAMDQWAPLYIWSIDIPDYLIDSKTGILEKKSTWIKEAEYRVTYNAGYSSIPSDLEGVAVQWVVMAFWQTKENPAVYPDFPGTSIVFTLDHYRRK